MAIIWMVQCRNERTDDRSHLGWSQSDVGDINGDLEVSLASHNKKATKHLILMCSLTDFKTLHLNCG